MDCPQRRLSNKSELCSACRKKALLEQRLQEPDNTVIRAKAEAEIIENNKMINQMHDPLHEIPRELASRIFELVFPEKDGNEGRINNERTHYYQDCPLVLGGVCSLWRAIAWATPQLWAEIHFVLNPATSGPCLGHARINLFREYIERSGALPLRIHVFKRRGGFHFSNAQAREFMDVLNNSSSRWNGINLDLPIDLYLLLSIRPSPNRNLQFLKLAKSALEHSIDFTQSTTNLPILRLWFGKYIEVSFEELKHIEDVFGMEAQFLELFRLAPLLKTAVIHLDSNRLLTPLLASLAHTSLKALKICLEVFSVDYFQPFFECLTLPALEELAIHSLADRFPTSWAQVLQNLINRSGCKLISLGFLGIECDVQQLRDILLVVPGLKKFGLAGSELSPQSIFEIVFGQAYCPTQSSYQDVGVDREEEGQALLPILPDLEEFTVACDWTSKDDWPIIFELLPIYPPMHQHASSSSTFLRLKMTIYTPEQLKWHQIGPIYLDSEARELVQRLGDQGVEISLKAITYYDGLVDFIDYSIQYDRCK